MEKIEDTPEQARVRQLVEREHDERRRAEGWVWDPEKNGYVNRDDAREE